MNKLCPLCDSTNDIDITTSCLEVILHEYIHFIFQPAITLNTTEVHTPLAHTNKKESFLSNSQWTKGFG